ncbi:hypothetical protein [Glycomyces halotolerans]
MIFIVGSLFGAVLAISAIRIGQESLVNFWMLGLTVVSFGAGATIGAFGVAHSVTRFDSRGLARCQSNGNFHEIKRLKQGERFVIAKHCLCIQRPDGAIAKTEIAKWRLRREDCERVAQRYPNIGATAAALF